MSTNTVEAWMNLTHQQLADRCVKFQNENTSLKDAQGAHEIYGVRFALASQFCKGRGIEVGAGNRPFPLPPNAETLYGDCRDHAELTQYFGSHVSYSPHHIDAQTFAGIEHDSADFVISAHVIEHLYNPLGSIQALSKVLRPGGYAIIAAPEMSQTFDRNRPVTTLDHVIRDMKDGGLSTRFQAFEEHVRFVHPLMGKRYPEREIRSEATRLMRQGMDLHVHAWTRAAFEQMMETACSMFGLHLMTTVSLWNENLVVLRRQSAS